MFTCVTAIHNSTMEETLCFKYLTFYSIFVILMMEHNHDNKFELNLKITHFNLCVNLLLPIII